MATSSGIDRNRQVSLAGAALQLAAAPPENQSISSRKQVEFRKKNLAWNQHYIGQLSASMPSPISEIVTVRAGPKFTQDQLDAVLYGYASSDDPGTPPFAISGIRPAAGSLSYGMC